MCVILLNGLLLFSFIVCEMLHAVSRRKINTILSLCFPRLFILNNAYTQIPKYLLDVYSMNSKKIKK